MKRSLILFGVALIALAGVALTSVANRAGEARATGSPASLADWQVVDLTQSLTPDIPLWPGDPAFEVEAWASYDTDGYFINRIAIGEHSGTHWGTPNTFIEGARSAEMIPAEELVVPAVVIDIHEQSAQDADYRLTVDDVAAWEAENGAIPAGSVVILFTGWQDKWGDPAAFIGEDADGVLHWPGFSAEAAAFLIEERGKRILLAPDELLGWTPPDFVRGVDLAVLPMGVCEFNPFTGARQIALEHPVLKTEATFSQTLDMVRVLSARASS